MRVLFSTTAGVGHFGPLVPFAHACVEMGHDVRVAAPESFRASVADAGLLHVPFDDAAPQSLGAVFGRIPKLTMQDADDLVVREVFGRLDAKAALPKLRAFVDQWHPDVIISETAEVAASVVAEQADIAQVLVNIGVDAFCERAMGLLEDPLRELGCESGIERLRHLPRWSLLPETYDDTSGVAPLARFREDLSAPGSVGALPDWWVGHDAEPFVYVTFGSVAAELGLFPSFYRRTVEALHEVSARILLTVGRSADPAAVGSLPDNVHVERWWPQRDLMQHAAVVIGHGGFGTTLAALAAGVPQVVIPLFSGDQFVNAERVAAVGAGVSIALDDAAQRLAGSILPAGPAVLDGLADAVTTALQDISLAEAARNVADEISRLPGAKQSTVALEDIASTR